MTYVIDSKIRKFGSNRFSKAEIYTNLDAMTLEESDRLFSRYHNGYMAEAQKMGIDDSPFFWGWKWKDMAAQPKLETFALMREGIIHGLVRVRPGKGILKGQKRTRILQIENLMVAPWNRGHDLSLIGREPMFSGVGSALMNFALHKSKADGFAGRLGTEPIMGSEEFYRAWGMNVYSDGNYFCPHLWCQFGF